MRTILRSSCCIVLVLTFATTAYPQWRAGVASAVITPDNPMWMAGYASRDHPAEGKLTELWAKVLVLEDAEGHQGVLITLDLIGIDRALAQSLYTQLRDAYGLDRKQIAICCSHTHTGPVVAKNLRPMHFELLSPEQKRFVDEYASRLERTLVKLVGQAMNDRQPSELLSGSGRADFAVNRRNNREADVLNLRKADRLAGPVDHDVPVLVVKQAGVTKAIVFGYACHATVLSSYQWSGDYPGFAQLAIEKSIPTCKAMFWAGCGADQNPLPRREEKLAREYGTALADAVLATVAQPLVQVADSLHQTYGEIELPLDELPTREQLRHDTQSSNRYIAARAKMLVRQIDAGKPLAKTYPYPIAHWQLGEQKFIFLGGEVVVDFALRIKSDNPGTWVAGYANDVMAYIPSRRVWLEGGYEGAGAMVYYGLPTRWAPDVETRILDEVRKRLR